MAEGLSEVAIRHIIEETIRDFLARRDLARLYRYIGPPVRVTFTAAGVAQEVEHRCGDVPDGLILIDWPAAITTVYQDTLQHWAGKTHAYLAIASAPHTVRLAFGVLREEPVDVNPT